MLVQALMSMRRVSNMNSSNILTRQGHRLLQVGIGLLLFTSFWGFMFPYLASPPLGLSVHKLSSLLAVLLLALGLTWPKLNLGAKTSRIAFWLLLYSALAIIAAYVLGAVWGAGNETMPIAAGSARGTALQESVIMVVAYSSGPTGIIAFVLVFWGLRMGWGKEIGNKE
jgi:hydroxylaminobenzene mutase